MPDSPAFLAGRLQSEGEKTVAYFQALSPGSWDHQIYTDGSCWSVLEILTHFVATEQAFVVLIDDIISGGEGAPEGFDIDGYNEKEVARREGLSASALIDQFSTLRQQTCEQVSGLSETDLAKIGRHPFLGVAPLADIIKLIYRHNQIHLRDIRRIVPAGEN
ncbi:MAG: DinB family protein [Chloroflexota bacterium]|nr:MAG: DinB family protein [Chloroflexota bacterium]